MFYLPDTNIFIYALAGLTPYAEFLRKCIIQERLGISVIVVAEFLSGAEKKEGSAFEKLLSCIEPLPVTGDIAIEAARYRKRFKRELKLPDALIAASCKIYKTTLVSNNLRDFPMKDIGKYNLLTRR